MAVVPIIVLAGQSNAARSGVDNRLAELMTQAGGAYELVKTALDGTSIYPRQNADWSPGSGELFDKLVADVKAAIANVVAQGHRPQVITLWIQGEADRGLRDYGDKLAEFVAAFRGAIGFPESEFTISLLQKDGLVRRGQLDVAERLDRIGLIDTAELTFEDGIHYDKRSREWIAEQFFLSATPLAPVLPGYRSLLRSLAISEQDGRVHAVAPDYQDLVYVHRNGPARIESFSGDDRIVTGSGDDWISTGGNDDSVRSGAGDDRVDGGEERDELHGEAGDDRLMGAPGMDYLIGGDGNDFLQGGEDKDRLDGGAGNDIYVIDHAGDRPVEGTDMGLDTVISTIDYTLGLNFENLRLAEAGRRGVGNAGANNMAGNARHNVLMGMDGNDRLDGGPGDDDLIGGQGTDTASYLSATSAVAVALVSGAQDTGGGGRDSLFSIANLQGSHFDDVLRGDGEANLLDGAGGADALRAGGGDDTYLVDSADDRVFEDAGQGFDTIRASASFALPAHVERLILDGRSWLAATGNALDNTLVGNTGANLLDGRGGADTLRGGAGNDAFIVDDGSDRIFEIAGEGNDVVRSSVSFVLAANLERLELVGSAPIDGTGNDLANTILGNGEDNVIDGGGGDDLLFGGAGDDIYLADSAADRIWELEGEGTDTVRSNVSFTLAPNIEKLILAGGDAVDGRGNSAANSITGNSAANNLDGRDGDDLMAGGEGGDVYIVNSVGDVVVERESEGRDTVRSLVSFTLGSNVERLVLDGSRRLDGTGNALDNEVVGNSGDNRLDGAAGDDAMQGGAGNDTYRVDSLGDRIWEGDRAGADTVETALGYGLGRNLENLVLLGTEAVAGRGNALSNRITGNAASNLLDGGAGADTLVGLEGDDTYVVDDPRDRILERPGAGTDTIVSHVGIELGIALENLQLMGSARIGIGNSLANLIEGSSGENRLAGMAGADILRGKAGDDILEGGLGADSLAGELGADILIGGGGQDSLAGGGGADTFQFAEGDTSALQEWADTVADFSRGDGDTIDLRQIDARAGTAANDSFDFIGGAAFSGRAGELRFIQSGGDTIIEGDTDGNGKADLFLRLDGTTALAAFDFIL